MEIYLAGDCSSENRTTMVTIARLLREYGKFEVYCPWELKIENAWDYTQEDWAKQVFKADIAAIQKCDIFLMISHGRNSTAGTNWENGYAFALKKKIIIIQITNEPTSLMTFCSASDFYNCNTGKYQGALKLIIDNLNNNRFTCGELRCETILT